MSEPAITVSGLGKRYRVGERYRYKALRDSMAGLIKAPAGWIGRIGRGGPRGRKRDADFIWAVKDVELDIARGEVVGIVGPNGAGKSTFLRILSRITEPTVGTATIRGRIGSLLEVGTGFHPELTGRENIALNGAILGMHRSEIVQKFDEIVAFAEIERFLDSPVKHYSSGMYVRLAFAVAAHLEPEILLVDEVLAVGDAAFQKKCLGKMGSIASEGRTVLFVSHNMGAINALCQRALLFENGSVVLDGDTETVTRAYLSRQLGGSEAEGPGARAFDVSQEVIDSQSRDDIRITSVELMNPADPEIGPRTRDPLLIRIGYRADRAFMSPGFVVGIKDYYGNEIIRLSSMPISGFHISDLYPEGVVELRIESLPLVGGRYNLDLGFVRAHLEWILGLDNVAVFDVQARDVYGSGILLDRTRGMIAVEHRWEHRAISGEAAEVR